MKALLKTYRQSPRKARLLADLIRGKKILDAKNALVFANKRSAPVFLKLIDSAVANAKQNFSVDVDNLFVKKVSVDAGIIMKRMMPRARGSGARINKRTSHIFVELAVKDVSDKKELKEAKSDEKVSKKKTLKTKTKKLEAKS